MQESARYRWIVRMGLGCSLAVLGGCVLSIEEVSFEEEFDCDSVDGEVIGDSCYWHSMERVRWLTAEAACVFKRMHLVSIDSVDELGQVNRLMFFYDNNEEDDYWIGGTDVEIENEFVWSSGDEFSCNNRVPGSWCDDLWGSIEPNGEAKQNCLEVKEETRKFNDKGCDEPRPYICEKRLDL